MASRPRAVRDRATRYGPEYRKVRAQWAPMVAQGQVTCWRCGEFIPVGAAWDLGHDDGNAGVIRGPEHARCNRGAAARKVNAMRRIGGRVLASREW